MNNMFRGVTAGLLGVLLVSGGARAEVLSIEGVYPAGSDGAATMNVIAVEPFGGADGADLAIRIEDALREVEIDGERYFRIVAGSIARDADGVLRGTATAEVSRQRYTEKRDRCVVKDDRGKCTERRKEEVRCTRRIVELIANIRLIARDGELVHTDGTAESKQDARCRDDSSPSRSLEADVRELSERIAVRTRNALAPIWRRESIRVLEDRKGLAREDAERFKQALRLTKSDAGAACRLWQAIAEGNPEHAATAFNVGLCAESADALDSAEQLYRRAELLSRTSNVTGGLQRLAERRRADMQLKAHFRR